MYVGVCAYVCVHTCVCIRVCAYVCVHTCVCIRACILKEKILPICCLFVVS